MSGPVDELIARLEQVVELDSRLRFAYGDTALELLAAAGSRREFRRVVEDRRALLEEELRQGLRSAIPGLPPLPRLERMMLVAERVPPAWREEFPSLTYAHCEIAATRKLPRTLTAEERGAEIRRRLESAADGDQSARAMYRELAADGERPDAAAEAWECFDGALNAYCRDVQTGSTESALTFAWAAVTARYRLTERRL